MSNSLRQVRRIDLDYLKYNIDTSVSWYVSHCDEIDELADFFQQEDQGVFKDILDKGLKEMQDIMEMLKEAKRGDEL